jgi:hypothetical protein
MSSVLEYTYDDVHPLDDREAVEKYREEKAASPDALVVIDDLGCGVHWAVKSYKTEREKEVYLRRRIERIWERFSERIVHK